MEYTIKSLADLAGVTTRTLRWYDQAALLKPCRVRPNGAHATPKKGRSL